MVPGEDLVPACITIESHHAVQDKKTGKGCKHSWKEKINAKEICLNQPKKGFVSFVSTIWLFRTCE